MTNAINKAINTAQKAMDKQEPYPTFRSEIEEKQALYNHINTLYMVEKIDEYDFEAIITKIHFCGYFKSFNKDNFNFPTYHFLFELDDGNFLEYNDERRFISRPKLQGKTYPEINGRNAHPEYCYEIRIDNTIPKMELYDVLKEIYKTYYDFGPLNPEDSLNTVSYTHLTLPTILLV